MDVDGDGLPDVGGHDAYGNADYSGPGGTTYDAIAIGFSHDNGGHDASFGSVSSNGQYAVQHSHSHMVNGPDGVLSREIELVDKDTRLFIARGVKHGDMDVWAVLAQVAPGLDLVRLDQIRPALDGFKITKEELADQADPWREPYDLINSPPPGWYAGATGRTKMELQIWQVGTRTDNWDKFRASILSLLGWNQLKKTAGFDKKARTYFEVRKVTWCFDKTQDFSTEFSLYIHSSKVWQSHFREYGKNKPPLEKHRKAAKEVIVAMLKAFEKAVPSPQSVAARRIFEYQPPVEISGAVESPSTGTSSTPSESTSATSSVVVPDSGLPPLRAVDINVQIPRS